MECCDPVSSWFSKLQYVTYSLNLDWGLLSYEPIPEVAFRAGRLIAGTWLFSQQINVGYSYLWVRPPTEVYGLLAGFYALNGASILTKAEVGTGTLSGELYAGSSSAKTFTENYNSNFSSTVTSFRITDAIGADVSYELNDALILHASYLQAQVSGSTESKLGVGTPIVNSTIPGFAGTVTTPLDVKFGRFYSVGEKFEYRNFILISEFARRMITGNSFNSASAWYTTLAHRMSSLTPYLTYSRLFGLEGSGNVHPETPTISTLQKAQTGYQIGLNAQVNNSVVLKAEFQPTYFEYADASRNFWNRIISASASFVF